MKEMLYEMFKSKGSPLSKSDIDKCDALPSYNTLNNKGLKLVELNREFKVRLYDENPKYCVTCDSKIEYSTDISVRKYCNHACAAITTNQNRAVIRNCTKCDKVLKEHQRVYCSNKCQSEHRYEQLVDKWLSGEVTGYTGETKQICSYVRKYLHNTRGTACEECGWDKRHPVDGSVLTEIDHIDGDAGNNELSNLKILCPNCHAMTPTFRNRNKVSSRNRNGKKS